MHGWLINIQLYMHALYALCIVCIEYGCTLHNERSKPILDHVSWPKKSANKRDNKTVCMEECAANPLITNAAKRDCRKIT